MTHNKKIKSKLLWKKESMLDGIENIVSSIYLELKQKDTFCIWLRGHLGAGKTSLTKYLLRQIGLDSKFNISSPTFTYLFEYNIKNRWYAHMDCYRLAKGTSLSDDSLFDSQKYSGFIIEWPEQIEDIDDIYPTHILNIEASEDFTFRHYTLFEIL